MPRWNVAVHFTAKVGIIEKVNAQGETVFVNRGHVKSFHFP
ncbi:hypothetical protein [Peribacillus sp. FSL P2-0133]